VSYIINLEIIQEDEQEQNLPSRRWGRPSESIPTRGLGYGRGRVLAPDHQERPTILRAQGTG